MAGYVRFVQWLDDLVRSYGTVGSSGMEGTGSCIYGDVLCFSK